MNRRGFLASLLAIPAALVAMPAVAAPVVAAAPPLALHPEAFRMVMSSLPTRIDVLYGVGTLRPDFLCVVAE